MGSLSSSATLASLSRLSHSSTNLSDSTLDDDAFDVGFVRRLGNEDSGEELSSSMWLLSTAVASMLTGIVGSSNGAWIRWLKWAMG